jgi:tRNA (guanosine-2'-O-)-methyltransferase
VTPRRYKKLRETLARRQPDLTVLVENVHKPHNVSALVRTCDAVGIGQLHAVSDDGDLRRHHMVSGGSKRWVKIALHATINEAVSELKTDNLQIVAAHFSSDAVDYRELDYTRPTAFLMGSELDGVSPEAAVLADCHTIIPMRGNVSSLNVSVATAILLYEAARQRELAGLYDKNRMDSENYRRTLFEWCYPDIAAECRKRDLPYPALDADGDLAENPFSQVKAKSAGRP